MAADASPLPQLKSKKKNRTGNSTRKPDADRFESFPCFLSLEEIEDVVIEDVDYPIPPVTPELGKEKPSDRSKSNQRERTDADGVLCEDSSVGGSGSEEKMGDESNKKRREKKKKKKKGDVKKEKCEPVAEKVSEMEPKDSTHNSADEAEVSGHCVSNYEFCLNDDDFYAWKELRLHPLLMKSIFRLGFKEPTPIQKACIPIAALQGKDVIGAAETGSGKTLAFGLPILQRLLEEWEKAARACETGQDLVKKGAKESYLRALVMTPTRELALQKKNQIRAVQEHVPKQNYRNRKKMPYGR